MLTTLGLFPATDPLDPAWSERISLTDVLLMMDPPEVVVRQLKSFRGLGIRRFFPVGSVIQ
jgi:hypothetical protein